MVAVANRFSRSQLLEGLSDAVVDLEVDELEFGWINEVTVKLMFKANTSLDQVRADRDSVQESYLAIMRESYPGVPVPELYFVLDEQREPDGSHKAVSVSGVDSPAY